MTTITIIFPTPEEEERSRRFQVHKNYVSAMNQFLTSAYGMTQEEWFGNLLDDQRLLPGYQRLQRVAPPNPEGVRRFLMISWASEAQLRVHQGVESMILPYANAWAPVHSYYAVYMSAVAWLAASGHTDASNHTAVLAAISTQVRNRQLFPQPWASSVSGNPDIDEAIWYGLPEGIDPTIHVELFANPSLETFWPRYCKMLETTRERRLKARYDDWKRRQGRRRISRDQKRQLAVNLAPTTVFDFFWRLRLRANYQDVELFLMSNVGEDWQREFYESLCAVTETTCLLFESLIVQRCGPGIYEKAVDDFRAGGGPLAEEVTGRRADKLVG